MNQRVAIDQHATIPGLGRVPRQGLPPGLRGRLRAGARHPVAVHLAVLLGYVAAGIALTWPRATYLADGKVPATLDASGYVWDLWWMAHCVEHLANPWTTGYLAAPVGTLLGLHTLMPLPGALLTPVTALFGPGAAYNLLTISMPGLLAYALYRVARLWLPGQAGPLAAGGFFGFSAILTWQTWMHLNLALAALFLPITLEAAVRLRRHPGFGQAAVLGVVLGASVLTDQETSIMAVMLAVVALVPWLVTRPWRPRLAAAGVAAMTAVVVASPQLIAIAHEAAVGGAQPRPSVTEYLAGIRIPNMFEPSPRLAELGLNLGQAHGWSTYGSVLSVMALAGLVLAWWQPGAAPRLSPSRRRNAWLLGLLWLGASIMALGAVLHVGSRIYAPFAHLWDGVPISCLMPYTWFVSLPGLSGFREPSRFAELGLVAAALLAGYGVTWIRQHARLPSRARGWLAGHLGGRLSSRLRVLGRSNRPVAWLAVGVVFGLGLLEGGMGTAPAPTMPATLPALDGPIAADHSRSVVVDVPFGLRGGVGITGQAFSPETLMLATADGHPLGDAYLSRVPAVTATDIGIEPFYRSLMIAQTGPYPFTPGELKMAADNARTMHIGWILLWTSNPVLEHYLTSTGFRLDYRADGAMVYRRA